MCHSAEPLLKTSKHCQSNRGYFFPSLKIYEFFSFWKTVGAHLKNPRKSEELMYEKVYLRNVGIAENNIFQPAKKMEMGGGGGR